MVPEESARFREKNCLTFGVVVSRGEKNPLWEPFPKALRIALSLLQTKFLLQHLPGLGSLLFGLFKRRQRVYQVKPVLQLLRKIHIFHRYPLLLEAFPRSETGG